MIFFVLSGFLISNSIKNALERDIWNWKLYAINRLCRLWIVLLPCLILTLFWDQLTQHLTSTVFYSGSRFGELNIGPYPEQYDSGLQAFFLNLFHMQSMLGPTYGSNTPLWSLANDVLVKSSRTLLLENFHSELETDHNYYYAVFQGCNTSCKPRHHFSYARGSVEQS